MESTSRDITTLVKSFTQEEMAKRVADLLERGFEVVGNGSFEPVETKNQQRNRVYWTKMRRKS